MYLLYICLLGVRVSIIDILGLGFLGLLVLVGTVVGLGSIGIFVCWEGTLFLGTGFHFGLGYRIYLWLGLWLGLMVSFS